MSLRILIVDDDTEFRDLAAALLAADGFTVAGVTGDGASAIDAVRRLQPDVVLLDVQMPGMDGFEVARRLANEPRAPRVVLTSCREARELGSRLTGSPAAGFVPKVELSGAALSQILGGEDGCG